MKHNVRHRMMTHTLVEPPSLIRTFAAVTPYFWFCFPQFQLPLVNQGRIILNGKFQKETIHKFSMEARAEWHDEIRRCPAPSCPRSESCLVCPPQIVDAPGQLITE